MTGTRERCPATSRTRHPSHSDGRSHSSAPYVERVPDPSDARARLVVVAPRGRELVELSVPVVREVEAAWEAHLGVERTTELRRTLAALREITDPWLTGGGSAQG